MITELKIEGMMCNHCTARVRKAVGGLFGVNSVEVSLEDKKAVVDHNGLSFELLKNTVEDLGFEVVE